MATSEVISQVLFTSTSVNNCQIIGKRIGALYDPVTWYGINYAGTKITQWDFQNKEKPGWTGKSSFVLKVPLRLFRDMWPDSAKSLLQTRAATLLVLIRTIVVAMLRIGCIIIKKNCSTMLCTLNIFCLLLCAHYAPVSCT